MSVEDYRDNFRYIHGNLTEWLPDGCRAVAADNRYSLARWAGAYWKVSAGMLLRAYAEEYAAPGEEDGEVSRIHISYEEPCTKRQLIEKAARSADESGLNPEDGDIHMYYPYPDMHLPLAIYSDKWLPRRGELTNNYRNFATDRLEMFDEAQTWDELIADGMFAEYSNSYLAVMSPGTSDKLPVFIKYSNDRAPQYRICTEIYDDADGRRIVKRPMTDAAAEHIAALAGNGSRLDERYKNYFAEKGVKVSANSCHMEGSNAVIEFLEYGTLESKLADFLAKGNIQAAMATVRTFADIVRYNSSYNVWDIDMIFKNIFVNDNLDEWIITDYEWTWQIDNADVRDIADYIIQRAVYYFIADNQGIQDGTDELYEAADLCLKVAQLNDEGSRDSRADEGEDAKTPQMWRDMHKIVYVPYAEAVINASVEPEWHIDEEDEKFNKKWSSVLRQTDRYYNRNLTKRDTNFTILSSMELKNEDL